jgi:hypothetical protein
MRTDTKTILGRIRQLEIRTRRLVNDSMVGEYHSVFKGRGMDFDEVREYVPGDEVRTIDWNVTARAGRPFVKKFTEERELTILLLPAPWPFPPFVTATKSGFFSIATASSGTLPQRRAGAMCYAWCGRFSITSQPAEEPTRSKPWMSPVMFCIGEPLCF